MLVALLPGSWWAACRIRLLPGSVAVDLWTDPDDNRSDNDGNVVAEGDDELEDAGCGEYCKNEDAGGDGGSIEDDDDGFGYDDDDYQYQDVRRRRTQHARLPSRGVAADRSARTAARTAPSALIMRCT